MDDAGHGFLARQLACLFAPVSGNHFITPSALTLKEWLGESLIYDRGMSATFSHRYPAQLSLVVNRSSTEASLMLSLALFFANAPHLLCKGFIGFSRQAVGVVKVNALSFGAGFRRTDG